MKNLNIENLLFQQVSKPNNHYMTKVNNVYGNKYRINLYCENEENDLIKRKICASYFCSLIDDKLNIIHGSPLNGGIIV